MQNLSIEINEEEILKMLRDSKEQYQRGYKDREQEIVRCKECEWHEMRGEMLLCKAEDKPHTYDWFCAGGRKKDDDG